MPGRGTPWRFSKGVKDRIGSADIKDDEITTDDIKQGTIKLEDLDTEVTDAIAGAGDGVGYDSIADEGGEILPQRSEINFVGAGVVATDDTTRTTVTIAGGGGYDTIQEEGTPVAQETTIDFQGAGVTASAGTGKTIVTIPGGGGGSNNLEGGIMFQFDMFLIGEQAFDETFNLIGGAGAEFGNFAVQAGGVLEVLGQGGFAGGKFGYVADGSGNQYNWFDFTGKDVTGKFGFGLESVTDVSIYLGFVDAEVAVGTTIVAQETPFSEATYFRLHSTTSGNWFAVTMSGGTKTETDTGVTAGIDVIDEFKIQYNDGVNVVFSINGTTVAIHTTNLPATDLGLIMGGNELTTTQKRLAIDYVQVEYPRDGGIGGGSGSEGEGVDLETVVELEDEFLSNDDTSIHQAWGNLGQGGVAGQSVFPVQVGGVFDMFHNNGVVGDLYGLEHGGQGNDFAHFDFTGNDCTGKFGVGFNGLTDMSAWVGFMDGFLADLQNPASIANIETNLTEGAYFRWHSTTSGNWFAVTMNGGTKTETDTGIAVTTGNIIKLKIVYEDATRVIFSINGSIVATHTTNLPATDLGFIIGGATLSVPNTNGEETSPHGVDYFQITQPRL